MIDMRNVLREICDFLEEEEELLEAARRRRQAADQLAKKYNIPLMVEEPVQNAWPQADWNSSGCSPADYAARDDDWAGFLEMLVIF